MDTPTPPPLPTSPPQLPPSGRPASSFASQAATFSVIAPVVAIGISILLQPQVRGNRWGMMILGVMSVLLIVLGLVFSEAPVHHLGSALMRLTVHGVRYRPFGVLVSKAWLFAQGGRPVIYQPDEEFFTLPDETRWRHVRYELAAAPPIDFSWEREWRIQTSALSINPQEARIVLPTDEWLQKLRRAHDREESYDAQMYELVIGEAAWGMVEVFPWTPQVLERIVPSLRI